MIDLGLNQNKIKEIKYEVKEGKTVIFKLNNFALEDVEIVKKSPYDDYSSMSDDEKQEYIEKLKRTETAKTEESAENECSNKTYAVAKDIVKERQKNEEKTGEEDKCEKFSLECLDKYGPKKHLDDYEPISCLRSEKGMQEALEASRRKMWKKDVLIHPSKEEKEEVSREIIQKDAKIDTDIIKERSKDRTKDEYYKGDPNDEYSKIKSFGDVNTDKIEFVDFLKDTPVMPKNAKEFLVKNGMKYVGQMKIDRKTDEIIDFKPNDNNKNDE